MIMYILFSCSSVHAIRINLCSFAVFILHLTSFVDCDVLCPNWSGHISIRREFKLFNLNFILIDLHQLCKSPRATIKSQKSQEKASNMIYVNEYTEKRKRKRKQQQTNTHGWWWRYRKSIEQPTNRPASQPTNRSSCGDIELYHFVAHFFSSFSVSFSARELIQFCCCCRFFFVLTWKYFFFFFFFFFRVFVFKNAHS